MPQDPNLYGQRAPKRQKKEIALPSSLAFSSELSSLIANKPSSSSSTARPRPSKSKPDIFAGVKAKRRAERQERERDDGKLVLKDAVGTEDQKKENEAARRRMEEKARLYAAMKRGDYVPKEGEAPPLVDFDRKWAQAQEDGKVGEDSSSSDNGGGDDDDDEDNVDNETVEYTDEYGRTRRGTRAEVARMERRQRVRAYAAQEAETMSARPKAPERVIYGDAIQSEAFRAADEDKMEELARKRDRSMTPPEMKHYDADSEIRTKGTGFYQFSKDEETRQAEMASLEAERLNTERERTRRDEEKERRRREVEERRRLIEQRRKELGEKKARKMADSFLDGLAADMGQAEGDKD
ncbi:hypothetical protein KVR01_012623 [Diaporthe batatas]|uniref:uncharacterized protein n=1 Tax=Diaporthe batatas TaxID=748121 RepID=UPI001D0386D3|nr:uncharacterized protein KVR01_012623 [Diaporthe batatas]KAG8157581.1 hypothetical protein KVR01_012623 [Diaporthe batatas]